MKGTLTLVISGKLRPFSGDQLLPCSGLLSMLFPLPGTLPVTWLLGSFPGPLWVG
jgi:hypothetical protein